MATFTCKTIDKEFARGKHGMLSSHKVLSRRLCLVSTYSVSIRLALHPAATTSALMRKPHDETTQTSPESLSHICISLPPAAMVSRTPPLPSI